MFTAAAVTLYAFLLAAWAVVLIRSCRGTWRGHLFLPSPVAAPPAAAVGAPALAEETTHA